MPILFALILDLALGDPPNRFHPTAWMGSLIAFLSRFRLRGRAWLELL
jgi:adenosylcobinamide-phosphate synthase